MKLECDVIRDLLPLYAEKLASPASSALVEQHLAECPACRAQLKKKEKPVPVQPELDSAAVQVLMQVLSSRLQEETM